MNAAQQLTAEEILAAAQDLRWQIGGDFHEQIMELRTKTARIP